MSPMDQRRPQLTKAKSPIWVSGLRFLRDAVKPVRPVDKEGEQRFLHVIGLVLRRASAIIESYGQVLVSAELDALVLQDEQAALRCRHLDTLLVDAVHLAKLVPVPLALLGHVVRLAAVPDLAEVV